MPPHLQLRLPERTLPFARLLILLLDPEAHLHQVSWNVAFIPQELDGLVIGARTGARDTRTVKTIIVAANQLDAFERILGPPFVNLLPDLADCRISVHGHTENAGGRHDVYHGLESLFTLCP